LDHSLWKAMFWLLAMNSFWKIGRWDCWRNDWRIWICSSSRIFHLCSSRLSCCCYWSSCSCNSSVIQEKTKLKGCQLGGRSLIYLTAGHHVTTQNFKNFRPRDWTILILYCMTHIHQGPYLCPYLPIWAHISKII